MLCAAALLCGGLYAQDHEREAEIPLEDQLEDLEDEISEFFQAYDTNSDGKVSIAEVKKAVAVSMETTVDDPSVAISLGTAASLMVAADTDADSLVSKQEYRELRTKLIKDPKYKPPLTNAGIEVLRKEIYQPIYKMVMDNADANGDGKLSRDEYKELAGEVENFDRSDTNKDGFCTKEELDAEWVRELGAAFEMPKDAIKDPNAKPDAAKPPAEEQPVKPPAIEEKPVTPPVVEEKPVTPPVVEEKPPVKEQPVVPEKKPDEPAKPAIDSVYNKPGRVWISKQISKVGTLENVTYIKTEVVSVTGEEAVVRTQVLNKDKQPLLNQPARESNRKLKEEPNADEPVTRLEPEAIKVGEVEFACEVTEIRRGQQTIKTWTSTKFPGLVVKMTSKSATIETALELHEFTE